jgi:predicted metal-binding membrane protein
MAALRRRPTIWVEAGVALSWAALAAASGALGTGSASGSGSGWSGGGSPWLCMTGVSHLGAGTVSRTELAGFGAAAASLAAMLPMLALMAVAMMVPTAMPAVRHVAVNSVYWRRRRAVAEFLAVFVAIWALFNLAVLGALSLWGPAGSPAAAAGVLALAALWQLTPAKRWALRACHRPRPLPPRGWRASAGVAGFGLRNGGACLLSCWALMLTTVFVPLPRLPWMAALTALIAAERLSPKPRRASRRVALALAASAVVAAAVAIA